MSEKHNKDAKHRTAKSHKKKDKSDSQDIRTFFLQSGSATSQLSDLQPRTPQLPAQVVQAPSKPSQQPQLTGQGSGSLKRTAVSQGGKPALKKVKQEEPSVPQSPSQQQSSAHSVVPFGPQGSKHQPEIDPRPLSTGQQHQFGKMPERRQRGSVVESPSGEGSLLEQMIQRRAKHHGELPGGWSESSDLSGVIPGENPKRVVQRDKRSASEQFAKQKKGVPSEAVQSSLEELKRLSKGDHEFKAGYINEAFETMRLSKAGVDIQRYQQEIPAPSGKAANRKPDLTIKTGQDKTRFVDVKTAKIEDKHQLSDMAAYTAPDHEAGVDVAFSVSSVDIDQDSLEHLQSLVSDAKSIRVRSNSMREGEFITPEKMRERQQKRESTHKTS